jgi:hypothetical protein
MGRLLPLALLVGFALGASAQEPPREPGGDRVAPEAVPARAEELARELAEAGPAPEARERLDRIETGLAREEPELDALEARVAAALAADAAFAELLDLRGELSAAAASLEGWQEELEDRGPEITALLTRLTRAEALWTRTQQHPETAEAGEVVVRRVQSALDLVAQTSASLRAWRDRVLALEDRVAQRQARLAAASERLEETAKARRTTLLVPDRAPLFGGGFVPEIQAELRRLPDVLVEFPDENLDYVRRDARPLVLQILLATILALAFREAGRGARGDRFDASVAAETRVLERPISIGVLLALIATPWIHPLAPRRFIQLIALIALLPVARIIVHASPEASRLVLGGLFALLALDRLALAVQELPALAEALVMLELALGFALAVRVWRRGGIPADPRRVRGGARIVAAVLAVALLGELGGWSELATLLGRGAIVCVLLAVYVWAAVAGLDALFAWVLRPPRWRPRLGHAAVGRRRAQRGGGWRGAGGWV